MTILVLFFIVFMGILFAINVYIYENSQFSKMTGYSFTSVWTSKKLRFLYKISQKFNKVNGDKKLLINIALPESGRKIDYLLLHSSGIYVVEAMNHSGWIYGNEHDIQWAKAMENRQLDTFRNPIMDNRLKIDDLKKLIPGSEKGLFQSLIIFSNSCSFKKIELHSPDVDVIKIHELSNFWKNKNEPALTKEQIQEIYSNIEPYIIQKQLKETATLKDAVSS